jgi:hypothetical protein
MDFAQTGTEYEKYVRDIQQVLLQAQDLKTVQARHDIDLTGNSGQDHQIDVYWEYRLAGVTHKVALECKLRGRKVDLGIVRDFWGVVDDVSGLRGVIVSPVGFISGAIRYAKNKGIGLKIIRPTEDEDYAGRIRSINLNVNIRQAVNLRLRTNVDALWYEENKTPQLEEFLAEISKGRVIQTSGVYIEDIDSGEVILLEGLGNYVPVLNIEETSGTHSWIKEFKNGYINYNNGFKIKLVNIEVSYEIYQSETEFEVGGKDVAHQLIHDALAGTLLFIDNEGLITGDTDEEGISKIEP